jgi:hypothetical protein
VIPLSNQLTQEAEISPNRKEEKKKKAVVLLALFSTNFIFIHYN